MTEYHLRDLTQAVGTALENMPVVVVTGMRQAGKTSFLCSPPELSGRTYVSFDDFAQLESAKSDPDAFIRGDVHHVRRTSDSVDLSASGGLTLKLRERGISGWKLG
ncbi:hypothetical protein ACFL9T_08935 [Thermodesulfobacteriota bacterium]